MCLILLQCVREGPEPKGHPVRVSAAPAASYRTAVIDTQGQRLSVRGSCVLRCMDFFNIKYIPCTYIYNTYICVCTKCGVGVNVSYNGLKHF